MVTICSSETSCCLRNTQVYNSGDRAAVFSLHTQERKGENITTTDRDLHDRLREICVKGVADEMNIEVLVTEVTQLDMGFLYYVLQFIFRGYLLCICIGIK
jgi:hypothetical protein